MKLNLPTFQYLQNSQNILIAGMGGGYDVFCGLPLFYEFTQQGKNVHLANFSSTDVGHISDGHKISKFLIGVGQKKAGLRGVFQKKTNSDQSFCELHLANWLQSKDYQDAIIWCFQKTGVKPLKKSYE